MAPHGLSVKKNAGWRDKPCAAIYQGMKEPWLGDFEDRWRHTVCPEGRTQDGATNRVLPSIKEGRNRGLETLWTDGATRFVRNEERRMARQTVCYHLPKKEGTVTWSMRR
jgi:hypothetical protein